MMANVHSSTWLSIHPSSSLTCPRQRLLPLYPSTCITILRRFKAQPHKLPGLLVESRALSRKDNRVMIASLPHFGFWCRTNWVLRAVSQQYFFRFCSGCLLMRLSSAWRRSIAKTQSPFYRRTGWKSRTLTLLFNR